jgi:cofilin
LRVPYRASDLIPYRLSVHPDCIDAFNDLKLGKNGTKYIIYKISDDLKEVVVDEVSKDDNYDVFREKLQNAQEKNGKSRPSYAVYDVAFDLDGGEGHRLDNHFPNSNHGTQADTKTER